MNVAETLHSKNFKITLGIFGVLIVLLFTFAVGVMVGFHKARFSYQWGENYERNFMAHRSQNKGEKHSFFPRGLDSRDLRNAHGLAGTILSMAENTLVIKDRDNKENTVVVTDKTLIKRGRDDIQLSDLKQDDHVVIIGSPSENGVINADMVRVFENK